MIMNDECSYGPEGPVSTFWVGKAIFSYSVFAEGREVCKLEESCMKGISSAHIKNLCIKQLYNDTRFEILLRLFGCAESVSGPLRNMPLDRWRCQITIRRATLFFYTYIICCRLCS